MKLNNLSRLTALLLALTMILPVFAAAEDTYTTFDALTGEVLTTYDSVAAFTEAGYCATCAEEVVYAGYTTWPVENNKCLYAYLAAMGSGEAYDYFNSVYESDYALSQLFVEVNQAHVDLNNEESALCVQASGGCISAGIYTVPGPSHVEGTCPWYQETEYVPMTERTLTSGVVTVSGKMPADVQLVVTEATVDTTIMDLSYFDSYETFGYNIALYRPGEDATIGTADDIKWQPKDSGETVTVTIAKAYSVANYPAVDVYHVKDDNTMELLTSRNGSVALTENATSFSFTVDEFSEFYCAAGLWSLTLSSGTSHEIYVIAGLETRLQLTIQSTQNVSISPDAATTGFITPTSEQITYSSGNGNQTRTGTMFTVGTTASCAKDNRQEYTIRWGNNNNNNSATVTIIVVDADAWKIDGYGATVPHIQINLTFDAVITDDDGNTTTATVKIPTPTTTNGNYNYAPTATTSSTTSFTTYAEDQTVTTTVNGTPQSLTTDTAVTIEIADPSSYGYSYPGPAPTFSVTSISNESNQLSFNGTFPVGVFGAPVLYRVTIDTTIKIPVKDANGDIVLDSEGNTTYKEQQVSLSKLIYYWHPDNICPGASNHSTGGTPDGGKPGIDIGAFGASIDGTGSLALTKTLAEPLTVDKTFKIYVYKYQENTTESTDDDWVKMDQFTVEITVEAGHTTATKTIVDIPYGKYKIVEDTVDTNSYKPNIDGYTLTVEYTTTDSDGNVDKTNVYTFSKEARIWQANVKNTYTAKTGNLVITKTVNDGAPEGDEFTFTVTLSDTSINGTYGEATFTNGVATLTLTGGQTAIITGIPAGTTYTVTEAAVPGYTTQYQASDDKGDNDTAAVTGQSMTGTIDAAGKDTVTFTNTYSVGNLSITKKVVGDTAPADTEFEFTVGFTPISNPTAIPLAVSYPYVIKDANNNVVSDQNSTIAPNGKLKLKAGQTATISGIQAGVGYTVTETEETDFSYTVTKTDDAGVIAANETKAAVFTNTYTKGDLTITKTVSGNGADTSKVFTFTVTIDASGTFNVVDANGVPKGTITSGGTIQLKHGETAIIKDLPDDTVCTVTETPVAGYATTVNDQASLSGSATIKQGTTVTIPFTNTYSVADLTITKKVVTDTNVTAPDDGFTITVNLTAGANVVLADSYTYTVKNADGTAGTDSTIAGSGGTITLKNGQTATISGLQVGTGYTVVETEKAYYTASYEPTTISTQSAEIGSGTNKVTVTNTYNTGNLKVTKQVEGTFAPAGEKFSFTLTLQDGNTAVTPPLTVNGTAITWTNNVYTFKLGHAESITIYGIPDGVTYTVTEVQSEGFAYTTKVNGIEGNVATGTIQADAADPSVTFTNTYKYSQLTITKTVAESPAAPGGIAGQTFNITVSLPNKSEGYTYTTTSSTGVVSNAIAVPSDGKLTIKNGEIITIDKVPIDGEFSVVEEDISYFDEKVTPNSGTIVDAGNTVAITNTYKPGKLTITKTVVGVTAPADDEFEFTVTLTGMTDKSFAANVTGLADATTLTFDAGVATFTMKADDSVTISNLPVGVSYTVVEADHDDYTTTVPSNSISTIVADTTETVEFINTYNFNDLTITKNVENVSDPLYTEVPAVEFPFILTLTDSNNAELTGSYIITNSDGTSGDITLDTSFNLKDGESITIHDLPVGATYTVTESAVEGFVLANKNGDTGTIEADEKYQATFTNEYRVGQLKISKKVEGADSPKDAEGNYSDVFTFNVSLTDATETAMTGYTYKIGENGEAKQLTESIELKDGQTAIIDKLPAGTTYVITESHPDYTTTKTNDTGTIEAGATSTAEFTNTYKYSHLTIKKTGMKAGESAIFTVTCDEKTYTVVVPNGKEIVIGKLPIGKTYTIDEIGDWPWLYTNPDYQYSNGEAKIIEGGSRVDVTNKGTDKWLHNESGVINNLGNGTQTAID